MLKRIIILFLLIPTITFAQFTDDFEDGDITNWTQSTPGRWDASGDSPLNGAFSLHHIFDNAIAEKDGVSISLGSYNLANQNTTWRFKIKYDYNPSDGNNWSVFLVSDVDVNQMIPSGIVNGYTIGVNFTGSDDILKLLKIASGSATEIITTSLNWDLNTNPSDIIALEIVRTIAGNWDVRYNKNGDFNNLVSIGTGTDNTYTIAEYFGIYYDYTSSADQLLWLDDIYVGPEIVDLEAPKVDNISVTSVNSINIEYSEQVDSTIAVNTLNYVIDKGIGTPDSVKINDLKNSVDVYFTENLTNATYYNIDIQNIEDQKGNVITDTIVEFLYYIPEKFDIVVNEIMADPTPEVGLPNYEFIEIKNNSKFDIDLMGWKLKVGTNERTFPNYILDSAAYITLCSETAAEFLDDFGDVIEFSSFPAIINTGTSIAIIDENSQLIDSINFTSDWYNDPEKDGGWTLERIDPLNTCSTISNWSASEDVKGGTPGNQNSIFASNIDDQAPDVEFIEIVSNNQLKLIFTETVTELSLLNKSNYSVSNGIGEPLSIISNSSFTEIDLVFLNEFPSEENLVLSVRNLEDECGNLTSGINLEFLFYAVKPYDVVINEIMIDPDPAIELPELEYIEIYNSTEFEIDLSNWKLYIGDSKEYFSVEKILANEYIILCDNEAKSELESYGNVISFVGLPTIPNTEGSIELRDKADQIISTIQYNNDWYQNEYKSEGGWSLEQIDPLNPCGGETNWIASESEQGGTPGQVNSVNASNPDLISPELLRITVIDSVTVQLFFSESINNESAKELIIYNVDNGIGTPNFIELIEPSYKSLKLEFGNEFVKGNMYTLEISRGIFDCAGNEINSYSTAQFSIPTNPAVNNIIVNEVMFNPLINGVDFVELYNRSNNTIDLKDLFISGYDYETGDYKSVEQISEDGFLIFPGEYVVITEDPVIVKEQYYTSNPKGFVRIDNLPSFNDDKGRVIILDKILTVIDDFEYSEDMQYPLLANTEGVSLERINYERETNDETNWHSASEIVGFATPAYENSQFKEFSESNDLINIEPEVFSPDNDGFEDFTNISFLFSEPGFVANIKIFDSKGRLIRYLANNKLLGIDGTITWDGLDDKNQKTPVGIYIVFIEIFDLDGNVKQFKESVVVATKW